MRQNEQGRHSPSSQRSTNIPIQPTLPYQSPYAIKDLAKHFQQALQVTSTPTTDPQPDQSTFKVNPASKPYIFDPMCVMDIEMTHTDPHVGKIAEIACYLVSGDLRQQILIANLPIKLDLSELKNEETIKRFTKSGLWQELQNPDRVTPLIEAEELIIKQFAEYGITQGQIPSAGI